MRLQLPKRIDSPNRNIFRAAVIVGFFTLLAKIGSTVKELVVARVFGRNDALDAFLIAYLLPGFVLALVMGAFTSALIPALVEARHNRGAQAAEKLFSSMMFISVLALAVVAVLLGLLTPYYLPWVAAGFPAAKLELTRELTYWLLPFILFSGFTGCASIALNAGEKFALPALAPLLTPLMTILFIAFGAGSRGPFLLVGGVVAGSLLEAGLLAWALQAQGMSLRLRWYGLTPEARSVLRQYFPMLAGAFLMSSTSVVDQSMAAMLPAGSVAALSYANKIVSVAIGIVAAALGNAAFPYISKMVAQNDWNGCRHTLKRYSMLAAVTAVPLALALMAFSRPLVRLLFQRGAFTSADAGLVSWVQVCYSIQVPFYVLGTLFVRFLSAIRRNDLLLYGSGINLVLDIGLNLLLMRHWGVAGIALSTSLVLIFSFFFVTAWSIRLLGQQQARSAGALQTATGAGPEAAG